QLADNFVEQAFFNGFRRIEEKDDAENAGDFQDVAGEGQQSAMVSLFKSVPPSRIITDSSPCQQTRRTQWL
ncbi:MAG: hypothetical protein LBB76_05405, partial [Azoarcus sp.]|nr:hypothetical protein [Azoarcus sp.]